MNKRKIGVLVSSILEHLVQHALHVFPQRIAPRLDHHAAAHRRVLRQIGPLDDLLIPLRIIFGASRGDGGLRSFVHRFTLSEKWLREFHASTLKPLGDA